MEEQLPELKRFLDRMSSEPQQDDAVLETDRATAVELGLIDAATATSSTNALGREQLIALTRQEIRKLEPVIPADPALETMSASPATTPEVP